MTCTHFYRPNKELFKGRTLCCVFEGFPCIYLERKFKDFKQNVYNINRALNNKINIKSSTSEVKFRPRSDKQISSFYLEQPIFVMTQLSSAVFLFCSYLPARFRGHILNTRSRRHFESTLLRRERKKEKQNINMKIKG